MTAPVSDAVSDDPGESIRSAQRLTVALGGVLVLLAGYWFVANRFSQNDRVAEPANDAANNPLAVQPGEGAAIRLVRRMPDVGDNDTKVAWIAGTTVFEATLRAADEPGWRSEWRGEGEMAFLESLGGVPNGGADGLNWQFEVNGEYAERGAGATTLAPGDRGLWKLAPYE